MGNYYETLGVAPFAPPEDVRRAYLKLAKENHPDLGPDSHDRFCLITEAYGVLKDPEARRKYDVALVFNPRKRGGGGPVKALCAACKGEGKVYKQLTFTRREERPCGACGGSGYRGVP